MLYLGDCLMLPGLGGLPAWDTLLALRNLESYPVVARIRLWDERTGAPVIWPASGLDYGDVPIEGSQGHALSWVPNNGLGPNPPQNWMGHGTIEVVNRPPFWPSARIKAWSLAYSGNATGRTPCKQLPIVEDPPPMSLLTDPKVRSLWQFVYCIPKWDEAPSPGYQGHSGPDAFVTGLSIQNLGSAAADITVTYTINQNYAQKGQQFSYLCTLGPNESLRKQLHEIFPDVPNCTEGFLDIASAAPAFLIPHLVVTTQDYLWGANEDFI